MDCKGLPDIDYGPGKPEIDELYPYYEPLEKLFYTYILTGGFPEAIREIIKTGQVSEEMYETLIRLILGSISKEGKSEAIGREMLKKLLTTGTNRIDYISIAQDIGVHHNTVREYIDLLEFLEDQMHHLPFW